MFRQILCTVLIGVLALSFTGMARTNADHKGRVLMADESKIMVLDEYDEMRTFAVAPSAKITRNGKPVALGELGAGDSVRITTEVVDGVETAVMIVAKTMA